MSDDDSARPVTMRSREETAAGCRSLAHDDRVRAEASDSVRMRFRLACSAEAWTTRADLLDRLEANRNSIELQTNTESPKP